MNRGLFIFRQDIRVFDNTGLYNASKECDSLMLVFILDTDILSFFQKDDKRLGFLLDALETVSNGIEKLGGELYIFYGKSVEILPDLCKSHSIDTLYRNRSYGENSLKRDKVITGWATENGITIKQYRDYLLVEPSTVVQMKVFTPFYKRRMGKEKRYSLYNIDKFPKKIPLQENQKSVSIRKKETLLKKIHGKQNTIRKTDRETINIMIKNIPLKTYDDMRNFPGHEGTSRLSPYLAFGLVSVREILNEAISDKTPGVAYNEESKTVTMDKKIFQNSFVSELAWREFRQHIAHYFPETWHKEFQEKRQGLKRVNSMEWLEAWKEGKTGYPIVDAAMRQLKEENRMHGRCRMIVASFLTKDLLIDRRYGEEHFKQYLLDYDKSVNIGNRQRSASVGPDPKPLRIFNPILQSQRFDSNAQYIKKRIPELNSEPTKAIHDPIKYDLKYIKPIVDHYVTSKIAKKMYYKESFSL